MRALNLKFRLHVITKTMKDACHKRIYFGACKAVLGNVIGRCTGRQHAMRGIFPPEYSGLCSGWPQIFF